MGHPYILRRGAACLQCHVEKGKPYRNLPNATHPTYPTLVRYHVFSQNATHPTYPTLCRFQRDLLLTRSPIPALHISPYRCCTVPLSGDIVSVCAGRKEGFAPPNRYIRRVVRFLKSFCELLFWGMNVLEFMRQAARLRLKHERDRASSRTR
jgi:hypothetical protein